jgi:head-tail adaptor
VSAGPRRNLVTFQHATVTQDEYGEEVSTWNDLGKEWAAIFWGRGDERRQAAMEQGQQAATFQVADSSMARSVTLKDRIIHGADIFDIVGIAPDLPKPGYREFTATRAL